VVNNAYSGTLSSVSLSWHDFRIGRYLCTWGGFESSPNVVVVNMYQEFDEM
jgi:hypothetical protein